MQIKDLINEFDFHDSNVIELIHEKNNIKMKIDLCMWKQKAYKESDNELKEIFLEFNSVENYIWDGEKKETDIDYDTILEMSYNNGVIKFILFDDAISVLSFKCSMVKIF